MEPTDLFYLHRCIQLAQSATRAVYPNPYVGSVIVHQGQIIGEGFHAQAGGPHAEVHAVRSVVDQEALKEATIYVSLEPCAHYGKTPPCADMIIQHQIPRVVIGMQDPFPKVDGGGIARLRAHGVEVQLAPDPTPFEELNKVFLTHISAQRPYIVLKWAESADGFIAKKDDTEQAVQTSISDVEAKRYVHRLRAMHQGILVGKHTALIDNPRLTTRKFYGLSPIRLVLDRKLDLPAELQLFQDGLETWVLNEMKDGEKGHIRYQKCEKWNDWKSLLKELFQQTKIASILVEGGQNVLQQFLDQDIWDEIHRIQSPKLLGKGIAAPTHSAHLSPHRREYLGTDIVTVYKRQAFPSQKQKGLSS
ncbi:MAG: bifunctional diaminohydroxyphosphoribosylaminopyrimidine deaminase/5-amino-6-(5-phosphoribosylamino)uracil reductase RibD [Bacteroidota bacterium]